MNSIEVWQGQREIKDKVLVFDWNNYVGNDVTFYQTEEALRMSWFVTRVSRALFWL